MLIPPVIVPPAFGKALLAVVCAAFAADCAVDAFETAVFAVDCAAAAAELADETPVSTYPLVAASAELLGAARFVNACEPIFKPPVIVPPAFGNAALAVDCAALAVEVAEFAVDCAAAALVTP